MKRIDNMSDGYMRISTVTSMSYDVFRTVKILNMKQCAFYMDRDVYPVDVKLSDSNKSGKKVLVFYFLKDDTTEVYAEWCKYKERRDA
jgi:hypothetical protein